MGAHHLCERVHEETISVNMHESFRLFYVHMRECAVYRARCHYYSLFLFLAPLSPWQPPDSSSAAHGKYFSPLPLLHVRLPHPIPLYPCLPLLRSHLSLLFTLSAIISSLWRLQLLPFPISGFLQFPLCVHAATLERVPSSWLSSLQKVWLLFAQLSLFHFCSLSSAPRWLPLTPHIRKKLPFFSPWTLLP